MPGLGVLAPTVLESWGTAPGAAPDTVITETPQDTPDPQAASQDRASETTSSTMLWIVPALLLTAPTAWVAGLWLRRRRV